MRRIEDLVSRRDRLLGAYTGIQAQERSLRAQLEEMKDLKFVLERVVEVLRRMIERATRQDLEKVERFVSSGLAKIMYDQNVRCKVSLDAKAGSSEVFIEGVTDKAQGPFLETFGGGTWNISGFILRLITILRKDLQKVMFLDESFRELSVEYQPEAAALVASLSKKLGFDILLTTHQPVMAEGADHMYRAKSVDSEMVLNKEW